MSTVSARVPDSLKKRFDSALLETGDSATDVITDAIIQYVESVEGETVEAIQRKIGELEDEREEYEEEVARTQQQLESVDARLDDLRDRLDDLQAEGDHDELYEELVQLYEKGADLRAIDDATGRVETVRKLGSQDSIEEVIDAVAETAGEGQ